MSLLVAALVTVLVSYVAASLFRGWAVKRRLLAHPNERSSHEVPTPTGGGVAIVAGFLAGLAVWLSLGGALSPRAYGWLAGALLVAGVSFVDDLRPLPARLRLAAHLAGASALTGAGAQGGEVSLLVTLPLAFLWVVLVTNIYNFMDGIDGLASGQAIVAGASYAVAGLLVGNPLIAVAGLMLAGAALGFLPHNRPRARLFMGDVGSTFLGFCFAALPLLGNLGVGGGNLPFAVGAVVLAPFLFDGVLTLLRRVLRGERWFEAHRSHYYQRLVRAGLSHGRVSALYAGLAMCAAAAAAILAQLGDEATLPLMALAYLPLLLVVYLVWRLERAERRQTSDVRHQTP